MSKEETQSIRQEYCKLKGWNFIEFEDAIQVQEYAIFLESQLAEKDKENKDLREKIINFKFYVDCGDISLMYENSRGDSTTAYSEMIKSLNK